MNKKMNKIILVIELVLIITGLILADMSAYQALGTDFTGGTEPAVIEASDSAQVDATAEDGAPLNDVNMPRENSDPLSFALVYVIPILVFLLLLIYVLIEYNKPHGNLLRITMLIYAFTLAIWSAALGETAGCVYILPCTAVIMAYVSGRLNKVKKNIVWFVIAGVLLIGFGILQTIGSKSYGILQCSYCFGALMQLIALALAYFSRYHEHTDSGLIEEPKAE